MDYVHVPTYMTRERMLIHTSRYSAISEEVLVNIQTSKNDAERALPSHLSKTHGTNR